MYDFSVEKSRMANILLNVEPGKTYYVRFGVNVGLWKAVPELLLIDSSQAEQRIASGSMRELDGSPIVRPKNRIGINVGVNGGFQNTPMIEMTDGGVSKLSYGGGSSFGLEYGHEVSRNFDLAFNVKYQFGGLSPHLQNADMTFRRGVLSATSSFVVPLGSNETSRLKFGAGPDWYFGSNLDIDTDEIPDGFVGNWKYNNPLGFHISAIYEGRPSDKYSYTIGLKYNNVKYKFNSSSSIYYPIDTDLSRPNGSGIEVVCGFHYHF